MTSVANRGTGGIFAQRNIAAAMEAIFDAPVATLEGQEALGRGPLWG